MNEWMKKNNNFNWNVNPATSPLCDAFIFSLTLWNVHILKSTLKSFGCLSILYASPVWIEFLFSVFHLQSNTNSEWSPENVLGKFTTFIIMVKPKACKWTMKMLPRTNDLCIVHFFMKYYEFLCCEIRFVLHMINWLE